MTPVIATLVSVNVAVPLLVSVIVWAALVDPNGWLAKVSETGARAAVGVPAPIPDRLKDCGLPGASLDIVNVAVRDPVVEGVNVTLMVQLALGARLEPQVLTCAKSPPVFPAKAIPVRFSVTPPVLVSVTICGTLLLPIA